MPKRLLYRNVIILFSLLCTFSCSTDFKVNAPYKEVYVVYGLLELHNPVQIIKITKLYQNSENSTAYQGAQQIDSLYQKDSLTVTLTDSNTRQQVQLSKYYDESKEPGIFAAPGQYLYRTPAGYTLNADHAYILNIYNPKTQANTRGYTVIVGDISPSRPGTTSAVFFTDQGAYYPITFGTGANAASYDLDLRIPVEEYRKSDSTLIRVDTIDWSILKSYNQLQGGKVVYDILGQDFFKLFPANLKVDNSIYRKIDSLDFDFVGASTDLSNYIEVNSPSGGVVQKKPDYTNLKNGVGIFTSRLHNHIVAPLSNQSYQILMTSDATKALNFAK